MTIIDVPRVLDTRGKPYRRMLRLDPCAYCPLKVAGTVDHIVPKSKLRVPEGARDLTGCCPACNAAKETTSLLLWLLERDTVHPTEHHLREA